MRLYGPEWGLLTNGEQYQIFRSEEDADEVLVDELSLSSLPTSKFLQKFSRDSAQGKSEARESVRVSEKEMNEIVELSQKPDIYERMVGSIAPSVYGYETEKLALLFALVGAVDKPGSSTGEISGAIDILFVHDPIQQFLDMIDATRRLSLDSAYFSDSEVKVNSKPQDEKGLIQTIDPKYGRFDMYEPIGEQIDLEPDTISQFDLIFTITDEPDPERDGNVCDNILKTHYAGELNTQREQTATSEFTQQQVDDVTEEVAPEIDADLLRKYIAHAKRSCYPTMTEEAKATIREFYVNLRSKGADEDAPIPLTDRKIEALVRLAEASARVRLSDTVETEDAERSVSLVRSCLKDIGVDRETGQFDADVVETATSKAQRDSITKTERLISDIEKEFEDGAPIEEVLERAGEIGMEANEIENEIEKLRRKGDAYTPKSGYLRVNYTENTSNSSSGVDAETVSTGSSKTQRDRIKNIKGLISEIEDEFERGAPIREIFERADEIGMDASKAEHEIEKLRRKGDVYEPRQKYLRTT